MKKRNIPNDEILHDLKCMDNILATTKNWTQGYWAKISKTRTIGVHVKTKDATCFCLQGAAQRCTPGPNVVYSRSQQTEKYLVARLNTIPGNLWSSVMAFNDSSKTTFRDVKALLKYAIEYRTWELEVKADA